MSWEPISPELALVDPELASRARAALADPAPAPRFVRPTTPAAAASPDKREHRPYPFWARVTAALWLLVLGVLIGGAAIPHAQDKPRVVPQNEDPTFCKAPQAPPEAKSASTRQPAATAVGAVGARYTCPSPGL